MLNIHLADYYYRYKTGNAQEAPKRKLEEKISEVATSNLGTDTTIRPRTGSYNLKDPNKKSAYQKMYYNLNKEIILKRRIESLNRKKASAESALNPDQSQIAIAQSKKSLRIEHQKEYRDAHKADISKRMKEYYQDNKETKTLQQREYYWDNRESEVERKRQYYARNADAINEREREYYPERKAAREERKRRQPLAPPSGLLTSVAAETKKSSRSFFQPDLNESELQYLARCIEADDLPGEAKNGASSPLDFDIDESDLQLFKPEAKKSSN